MIMAKEVKGKSERTVMEYTPFYIGEVLVPIICKVWPRYFLYL